MVVVGGAVGAVLFLKFKKPEVYKRVLGRLANVVGNNSKSPKVGDACMCAECLRVPVHSE